MEHSLNLMWMFLDILWDEDFISEGVFVFFFKWEAQPSAKRWKRWTVLFKDQENHGENTLKSIYVFPYLFF